ncbi:MAG: serine/threonine-protein kinase [Sulfuricurvum sp.]|uniref:serine/threonine protein kinase n=1 Tax=Sulfuricurvum sp. TaxID=2025608 RepID=UPI00260757DA|nr:serine/threonine-protein kinase [Sulfuricurvum sp.]MDD5158805.1 serine/threonine-protein kinase [Sulfuricurvum sp.]
MSRQQIDIVDLIPVNTNTDNIIKMDEERRLNNRYAVGERLGIGGLSVVYEARDDYSEYYGDDRRLAVKLPLEHLSAKSDIDAFMYAEYAHLSRLSHPNIIKVIDFGIDAEFNIPYIVLEQLNGRLLNEIPLTQFSISMKWNLLYTLFKTIEYLHTQHIVHADINPNNIMYLDDESIKLFDFGISINLSKKQLFELDYNTIKAYNPRYAAPEVIQGDVPTFHSDLFSMAVVCFELYSGQLPYIERSTELFERPITLRDLKLLPFGLRRWFKYALSADPMKRNKLYPLFLDIKKYI